MLHMVPQDHNNVEVVLIHVSVHVRCMIPLKIPLVNLVSREKSLYILYT